MMILQASDLPFVSVSRSYTDVWRLKEVKASLAFSILSFYPIVSDLFYLWDQITEKNILRWPLGRWIWI